MKRKQTVLTLLRTPAKTSIPLWPVIVCAAGEIALTFIFALFMLKKLGRRSPLELLQGKK